MMVYSTTNQKALKWRIAWGIELNFLDFGIVWSWSQELCQSLTSFYLEFWFKAGKLLNGVVFVISICSQLTYFYDAQQSLVEKCVFQYPGTLKVWNIHPVWLALSGFLQFDFILNVLFMSYFFMRFRAANDKLVFMFQLYTMIDFFTIPPSFVSLILGRVWIGLRCLRIMRLNSFPEILQYLNILTTARSIRYALCNAVLL